MKNVVATAVAVLLGLVSVYLVHSYIQSRIGQKVTTVPVVAATTAIPAGTKLSTEVLAKRELPETALPPGYIPAESFSQALGRELQFPARSGDPILWSMLRAEATRVSDQIPQGKRAVTFSVSNIGSVAHQVQPGDLVDVYCTITTPKGDVKVEGFTVIGGGGKEMQAVETMILLTKLKVLSVDFRTNRRATAGYQEQDIYGYGSMTVLASPEEAEVLIFTGTFATLACALRHPKDPEHPIELAPLDLKMFKEMLGHVQKRRAQSE